MKCYGQERHYYHERKHVLLSSIYLIAPLISVSKKYFVCRKITMNAYFKEFDSSIIYQSIYASSHVGGGRKLF